jgi:hypothetical protein
MELTTPNQVIVNITPHISIPYTNHINIYQKKNLCKKYCNCLNNFLDLSLKIKIIILLTILIVLGLLGFIIYLSSEFIKIFS